MLRQVWPALGGAQYLVVQFTSTIQPLQRYRVGLATFSRSGLDEQLFQQCARRPAIRSVLFMAARTHGSKVMRSVPKTTRHFAVPWNG